MQKNDGQRAVDGISRRSVLRGGLLAGAGVATVGAMSAICTGTAKASTPSPQYDWGWCQYCSTMWWTPGQSNSACEGPYAPLRSDGFKSHVVGGGSYNYGLYNGIPNLVNTSNPQPDWRWCDACQGLFWGGFPGHCAGKGINPNTNTLSPHTQGGTSYDIYLNTTGQAYWRFCGLCSLLRSTSVTVQAAGMPRRPPGSSASNWVQVLTLHDTGEARRVGEGGSRDRSSFAGTCRQTASRTVSERRATGSRGLPEGVLKATCFFNQALEAAASAVRLQIIGWRFLRDDGFQHRADALPQVLDYSRSRS